MKQPKVAPKPEHTLPVDPETEKVLLGAILMDNQNLFAAQAILTSDDFYIESHRLIFEAMGRLHEKNLAIDYRSVANELSKSGKVEANSIIAYIVSLTDGVTGNASVETYAKIVKEKATLRRLIRIGHETMEKSRLAQEEPDAIIESTMRDIHELAGDRNSSNLFPIARVIEDTYKDLEKRAETKLEITGIPSGLSELDRLTLGFHEEELIVVAARPGCGKTTLLLNIALHAATREKRRVAIFSLEMGLKQLARKLLACEAEVDGYLINTGKLTSDHWNKLNAASGRIYEAQMFVSETSSLSLAKLEAKAHRLKAERGLDLLVIDYLQLLRCGRRMDNRIMEVSEISRGLKELAMSLKIPVLAASQMNRAIEHHKRRPMLSDLRESGSLEQDSDVVVFIHRDNEDEAGVQDSLGGPVDLIIEKNRGGPTGVCRLMFQKNLSRFALAAREGSCVF